MTSRDQNPIAQRLLAARRGGPRVRAEDGVPADAAAAYAVQEATLAQLGRATAWKVGAKTARDEPTCAPLPASGVLASGASLAGPEWQLRAIELEVAVRLGRDLPASDASDLARVSAALDAMLPAIEVVETRLADRQQGAPLLPLADLQSHGALVLGTPVPWRPDALDLRTLAARVTFDGAVAADTRGGHPTGELLPLLAWLAVHAAARGRPLRAGDIVTTGSCTGMQSAPAGAAVHGDIAGLGTVSLRF